MAFIKSNWVFVSTKLNNSHGGFVAYVKFSVTKYKFKYAVQLLRIIIET